MNLSKPAGRPLWAVIRGATAWKGQPASTAMGMICVSLMCGCTKPTPPNPADPGGTSNSTSQVTQQTAAQVNPLPSSIPAEHAAMRKLVENAFQYIKPEHGLIDPVSGYPFEGWNDDPQRGLFLRSFTQITAIGQWIELLANIAAGQADNNSISREDATVERVMSLLDRRVVLVAYGDNVNLTTSVAKTIGALLNPDLKDNPTASAVRSELEAFLEAQAEGYRGLIDHESGMFSFGRDETTGKFFGWNNPQTGKWVVGHQDYLVNEFRDPSMFRYGASTTWRDSDRDSDPLPSDRRRRIPASNSAADDACTGRNSEV